MKLYQYIQYRMLLQTTDNLKLKIRNYRTLCCVLLLLNILTWILK